MTKRTLPVVIFLAWTLLGGLSAQAQSNGEYDSLNMRILDVLDACENDFEDVFNLSHVSAENLMESVWQVYCYQMALELYRSLAAKGQSRANSDIAYYSERIQRKTRSGSSLEKSQLSVLDSWGASSAEMSFARNMDLSSTRSIKSGMSSLARNIPEADDYDAPLVVHLGKTGSSGSSGSGGGCQPSNALMNEAQQLTASLNQDSSMSGAARELSGLLSQMSREVASCNPPLSQELANKAREYEQFSKELRGG